MYSCITILGLGSLGGYVVDAISEIEGLKKIILVDYDQVEKKNLKNTIYKLSDVGNLKTDVLSSIIYSNNKSEEIEVIKLNEKFVEGKTQLPKSDLVLDCRDFTYDRERLVDARFYISSRYLVIDCRKDVKYEKHYEGKYIHSVEKFDLTKAAFYISMLICDGNMASLIDKRSVAKLDLDHHKSIVQKIDDVMYSSTVGQERLVNLNENLFQILKLNKQSDLDVFMCMGDSNAPLRTIPKGSLRWGSDVVNNLVQAIDLPFLIFNTYVISIENGAITLIPETGAA